MNENEYTIYEAKTELENIVKGYLARDGEGYLIPATCRTVPILIGPAGVGKTEVSKQVAQELGIGFLTYSLVHHTRNSLLGLPAIMGGEEKRTEYTMPEIISAVKKQCEQGHDQGILFLDEINCMSDTVAPVMLAFLQQGTLGQHTLPSGWIIALAGNPKEYNRSVRSFDAVTLDRMRVINVGYDTDAWLVYASGSGVHEDVIDFIRLNKQMLYNFDPEHRDDIVTPRGWSNLSRVLNVNDMLGIETDKRCIRQFIKSDRIAYEFWDYRQKKNTILSPSEMDDILLNGSRSKDYTKCAERYHSLTSTGNKNTFVEKLCDYSVQKAESMLGNEENEGNDVSACLNNIYEFLGSISADSDAPAKQLSSLITQNKALLKYVSVHEITAYNRMMMLEYDVPAC